jgi:hypothetical protein
MGIEELARRNPVAAEQLKRAAEAAVVERMVAEAEQTLAVGGLCLRFGFVLDGVGGGGGGGGCCWGAGMLGMRGRSLTA